MKNNDKNNKMISGQDSAQTLHGGAKTTQTRVGHNAWANDHISDPINVQARNSAVPHLALYGRMKTVEEIFGIKRSMVYSLINDGKIKSVSLCRRGNARGC